MNAGPQLGRRGFIGAALVGFGALGGWVARKAGRPAGGTTRKAAATPLTSRFAYDLAEFEKTDPALLRYRPSHQFNTRFEHVKRLAVNSRNQVWVAGDRALRRFSPEGEFEQEFSVAYAPHFLCALEGDELLVGFRSAFELFTSTGKSMLRSPNLGGKTFCTAAALNHDRIYLADAGNREVIVCDRTSGAVIARFGRQAGANPGFVVPSPYFDLALAANDRLLVANPGRLRLESYTLEGRFESAWGEPGLQIDRFCGCCNPVYFATTPNGEVITSEKGLARIKVYSSQGDFRGVVAGPDTLVEDKELARRACGDCTAGSGFDVAADSTGRIFALDPFRGTVRVFLPIAIT